MCAVVMLHRYHAHLPLSFLLSFCILHTVKFTLAHSAHAPQYDALVLCIKFDKMGPTHDYIINFNVFSIRCGVVKAGVCDEKKSRNKFEMKSTSFTERSHSDVFCACLLARAVCGGSARRLALLVLLIGFRVFRVHNEAERDRESER